MGSPSDGGDVAVYVFDVNQLSLPTHFYSILVSISVFMALSPVFLFISSPDNSPFSHSVLPVLFLPYCSFQQYISLVLLPGFHKKGPKGLSERKKGVPSPHPLNEKGSHSVLQNK